MKEYYKIFQNQDKKIEIIKYSEVGQKNYFNFTKTQLEKGLRQVIVTSEIMLDILRLCYLEYSFDLIKISFEEDNKQNEEIERIINKMEKNRTYFIKLQEKLECIVNESSIDIESIKLKSTEKVYGEYIVFSIKVNGIISIDGNSKSFLTNIINLIENKL